MIPLNLEEELRSSSEGMNSTDSRGNTPTMWAARRGDSIAVCHFINAGANVNWRNEFGASALLLTSQSSDITCANLLIQAGADPKASNSQGHNPLHYAAAYLNEQSSIAYLVNAGTEINGRDNFGLTPLSQTVIGDHSVSAEALLDLGAEINTLDNEGDSPLHSSLVFQADQVTQLLLRRGATYTQSNRHGNSILHSVAAHGGSRALDILLANNLQGIHPGAANKDGKTAMDLAQHRARKPEDFLDKFQQLLDDVYSRNAGVSTTAIRMTDGNSVNEDMVWCKIDGFIWSAWAKWKLALYRIATTVQGNIQTTPPESTGLSWVYIWLSGALVLCIAGIMYKYLN